MTNFEHLVENFHIAFGLPTGFVPRMLSPEEQALRRRLILEEVEEYTKAVDNGDLIGQVDGLADIVYIAIGTAISMGINFTRVFEEVHRTNMAKLVDGKPIFRPDGKVLKPEGWTPPDIAGVMGFWEEKE